MKRFIAIILAGNSLLPFEGCQTAGPQTTSVAEAPQHASRFGQSDKNSQDVDRYFSPGMHRAQDGKEFALFLDAKRSVQSVRKWEREDELLKAVSQNSQDLLWGDKIFRAVNKGVTIQGKKADDMLVIGLYPRIDIPSKGIIKEPVTFTSGTVATLDGVIRAFGDPAEKEPWIGKVPEDFGLRGDVYWWGHVGIAASVEGAITHVLVRENSDDASGK